MVDVSAPTIEETGVSFSLDFLQGDNGANLKDFTIQKITLGESLLTPGLQTEIIAHSYRHNLPVKNYDQLKGSVVSIAAEKPILNRFRGMSSKFKTNQIVYRMGRKLIDNNNEEITIRACDQTQLNDLKNLVSKSWKCSTPSEVVSFVLSSCAGATALRVESSSPARPYVAENIHPFQVVAQQAQVALAGSNDPSFVHFMTFENGGTHHFRSLYNMTKQGPAVTFVDRSGGTQSYGNQNVLMSWEFPCDFDLIADVMNGTGPDGEELGSVVVFNPVNKMFSLVGNQTMGCGVGKGVVKMAQTNKNTNKQQDSCPISPETYMRRRQARMSLLERDKIALRCVVPWNPTLNAGKVIDVNFINAESAQNGGFAKNYGSGKYLILHLYHTIQRGGYGTTTMDCVSTTVGQGIV
jgi:hypothetical protein